MPEYVDEDLTLFLEEFGKLLNKFHYVSMTFTLSKFKHSQNFVSGFIFDQDTKEYHCDLVIVKRSDENET